jgi:hypothetical protein
MSRAKYKVIDGKDKIGVSYLCHTFKEDNRFIKLENATQKQLKRLFEAGNNLVEREEKKDKSPKD